MLTITHADRGRPLCLSLCFKKTFEVKGFKYDRLIQNSGNIVYFGHVRFPALLGKLSKLQQQAVAIF